MKKIILSQYFFLSSLLLREEASDVAVHPRSYIKMDCFAEPRKVIKMDCPPSSPR